MDRKIKRILIWGLVIIVLMMCDVTCTKDDEYTKVNNIFSVLFTDTPLIEKGIIDDETE